MNPYQDIKDENAPILEPVYEFRLIAGDNGDVETPGADVLCFLEAKPDLVALLHEAVPHLEECFGPFPQVVLEIVDDPEVEDLTQLVANIRTALPVEEAINQLARFDETWFLDQLPRTINQFNFNLEFV
jgi:hypothetical protein